ncbi:hypothetical protein B5V03_34780 [Bradyrhizobium betae]|uniref:Uncharacterized protein n=1 Tax=Bradyrhizobium betae TaxID=244734 RepID=A0A4Q1UNH3_9BRAD|nr:hypothetical protein B5V03_34780 [Bradyrhizobium betae]
MSLGTTQGSFLFPNECGEGCTPNVVVLQCRHAKPCVKTAGQAELGGGAFFVFDDAETTVNARDAIAFLIKANAK